MGAIRYRADIDGLRAIAVLAVLLFHAGADFFPGGFVGVDVFFVISGYLITSIIVSESRRGEFSFVGFYERRIRRIVPAFLTVIAVSAGVGWFTLLPQDYVYFARSAFAAAAFHSNFYFGRQAEDYFAPEVETQPLLHTWSLSVEEQFYLIAPVFILLLLGRSRRLRGALVLFLLLLSIGISAYGVKHGLSSAFYLLPSRAFELLIGVGLAIGLVPVTTNSVARQFMGLSGLVLIAYATFFFSSATPFPGLAALVPCLGAALLIHSGGSGSTPVHRVLGTRPMVFVGKISFSLYLWHWPLLAFARYGATEQLSVGHRFALLGLSLVLSIFTYYLIEQPVRQRRYFPTRPRVFAVGGVALLGCLIVSRGIIESDGALIRLQPEVIAFVKALPDKHDTRAKCLANPENDACLVGDADASKPSFLLWGDSHAQMFSGSVGLKADALGIKGYNVVRSGCPPIFDFVPRFSHCVEVTRGVENILKNADVEHIILASRWAIHQDNIGDEFLNYVRRTVDTLQHSNRSIAIIASVPELPFHVPKTMTRDLIMGEHSDYSIAVAEFLTRQQKVLQLLQELDSMPKVRVLYPHMKLCDGMRCDAARDDHPLYVDDDHLGPKGVEVLSSLLDTALAASSLGEEVVGRVEQSLH